jgi:hypothetical protein
MLKRCFVKKRPATALVANLLQGLFSECSVDKFRYMSIE